MSANNMPHRSNHKNSTSALSSAQKANNAAGYGPNNPEPPSLKYDTSEYTS